jgi:hypothetical protein
LKLDIEILNRNFVNIKIIYMKKIVLVITLLTSFGLFSQENEKSEANQSSFIIKGSVGPSFRLAKTPSNLPNYLKSYVTNLKSGMSYDFSGYFLINKSHNAIGLKYNSFNSKASIGPLDLIAPNGETGYARTSDDITISFIGLSYGYFGLVDDENGGFDMEMAFGLVSYKDKTNVLGAYEITGSTIGLVGSFGYDIKLVKGLYLEPKLGYAMGTIGQFDIKGENGYKGKLKLEGDSKESLFRFDFSAGLNYRF